LLCTLDDADVANRAGAKGLKRLPIGLALARLEGAGTISRHAILESRDEAWNFSSWR
jgi:hypothetical protein